MARPTDRRPAARRLRAGLTGLLLALMLLAGTRDTSRGSGGGASANLPAGGGQAWQTGRAVPIVVEDGRARFSIPTPSPGSRTLLIVSALARGAATFPVEARARPIDPARVRPPAVQPTGPTCPPELSVGPLPPVPPPGDREPPAARTFHLMVRDGDVLSPSNYVAVSATLRAVGTRVQVYVDERDAGSLTPGLVRDVVDTFDRRVFPFAARTLGVAGDVDGDGRFTVLLSGWLARLGGGRHAVDGFVRGADLDPALPAPFSNHCDMMYLNAALPPGPHLRTVIAHEYTHAVAFTARTYPADAAAGGGAAGEEEGWLDEALAHLVEDAHGFSRSNLDYRVSAFLSQPERYRLVVEDYYAADLFRSHGNRGGTYLFLRWCADRFGTGLVPALLRSHRQGVANLEAATGTRFADLYRAWSVALFTTGFDPSRPPRDGLRSVNVRRPFDDWVLAGPRTDTVTAGGPAVRWESAGTASRYLIVGSAPAGAVEVEVAGPAEAGLQVTALPLPDDLARLELSVRPVAPAGGAPALHVAVTERNGTRVDLSAVAWEPLVPGPDPHAARFRHAGLDARGVASAFGSATLPGRGRLISAPIPAGAEALSDRGMLVVKAVGTDAHGRRVAAWAEVGARDVSSSRR